MAGKVIQLGILLKLLDKVSGPASKVNRSLQQTQSRAEAVGKSMQKIGAIMAATGAAMTAASFKIVSSTFDSQRALGELASLGIKDLKVIEDAATQTSNRFAGITKPAFITAAYDIKSAISNLADSAVADYTRISAVTAKATKGSVEQMGDLFATGYGIYKELFPKMTDARFAEVFSGAIAKTVQEFKMTGPKIMEYVSILGASATKKSVGLAEQFAIGGMLGATMSGSEAATKYGAFLTNPEKVAQKLGIRFTDANNRLLPMADILDRIRGKFGAYIDTVESGQLIEAFGRKEGVKLVELLIDKTDELRRKTLMIQEAMGQGAQVAADMANLIDRPIGQRWIIFKQQFHNLIEKIGITIEPLTRKVFGFLSKITLGFQRWVDAHPALTKLGMSILMVGGALLSVAGILTVLGGSFLILYHSVGGLNLMLFAVKYYSVIAGMGLAKFFGILRMGILAIGRAGIALLTNPIFLAITAIALGAYIIIRYWQPISGFFISLFNTIGAFISANWKTIITVILGALGPIGWIVAAFLHWNKIGPIVMSVVNTVYGWFVKLIDWLFSLPSKFWEAGKNMIISLWEGIKKYAMMPVDALIDILKKLRNLLPFSDPKDRRSPLYGLHKAGIGITDQIAQGIEKGTGKVKRAALAMSAAAALAVPADSTPVQIFSVHQKLPEFTPEYFEKIHAYNIEAKLKVLKYHTDRVIRRGLTTSIPAHGRTIFDDLIAEKPIVERPSSVNTNLSGVGTEGGIGTGGMVIYLTQHFERDSINLRGNMIDAETFRKMMGKVYKAEGIG